MITWTNWTARRHRLLFLAFLVHLITILQHMYGWALLGRDFGPKWLFPLQIVIAGLLFFMLWRRAPK